MFERLTIRRQNVWGKGAPVDIGLLAEALLFYQTTHVMADYATLEHIFGSIGPQLVLKLLERGDLSLSYTDQSLGIQTYDGGRHHQPVLFTADKFKIEVAVARLIEKTTGHSGKGSLLARQMLQNVRPYEYPDDITGVMRSDARSAKATEPAIAELVREYAPAYQLPIPVVFQVEGEPDLTVHTNIDFDAINRLGVVQPSNRADRLTPALLLAQLAEVTATLRVGAERDSELSLAPVMSRLVQRRLSGVLSEHLHSAQEIATFFKEVMFEGPGAIRDAINSGERSFGDLVSLLEHAGKFKTWLEEVPAESNLAISYYRELTRDRWFEGLGVRAVRYIVMLAVGLATGAVPGAAGQLAGAGLSAFDSLLLDKLIGGWMPNQFVDEHLRPFVSGDVLSKRRRRNRRKAERRQRQHK